MATTGKIRIGLLLAGCFATASLLFGQNKEYARYVIDTLASPAMHGRGYVMNGDKIASVFIADEFQNMGLSDPFEGYLQDFSFPVNTLPGEVFVSVDGDTLKPGIDYVVLCSSPSTDKMFSIVWDMPDSASTTFSYERDKEQDMSDKIVITEKQRKEFDGTGFTAGGVIFLAKNKVWWHVSDGGKINNYLSLFILRDKVPPEAQQMYVRAETLFYSDYVSRNVAGTIHGNRYPEKYIVVGAHYDHLGRMGSATWFPGANDNASGVALMLDLAGFFSLPENTPPMSIIFAAFGAEEAGLIGSSRFVENPPVPLEQIRFMLNFDMVGSGSEGITVVNGTAFPEEFTLLQEINAQRNLLPEIKERGESPNSDHHPFYSNGVPAFFIYTRGKECTEYHTINDIPEDTPLTEYENLFRLITDFILAL